MSATISLGELEKDPILRTYHIPDKNYLCYDASGFFSPISIKDQIIRVVPILDRAQKGGLISDKRPLLIVGGGIAGVVAAIRAAEMNVKTVIIDKDVVLNNIVTVSSRYVCPTQYDWTAVHWDNRRFIINSLKAPSQSFILEAGPVNDRIQSLRESLTIHRSFIHQCSKTQLNGIEIIQKYRKPFLKANFKTKKGFPKPKIKKFGMAISCVGFGREKVFVDNTDYRGLEFWKLADHEDVLKEGNPDQKVLICGGGDGSLQDYLLMVSTADTVRQLYEDLKLDSSRAAILEGIIARAEEKAKRKEVWLNKSSKKQYCMLLKDLHQTHLEEVNDLLKESDIRSRIQEFLRKEKTDSSRFVAERLRVYFDCDHFSTCYPLNRFMALLVSEYLRQWEGVETMYGHKSISKIAGVHHTCKSEAPQDCDGKKHWVTTHRKENCFTAGMPGTSRETFDTVIVRFGLDRSHLRPVFGEKPAFPGTQILPYVL